MASNVNSGAGAKTSVEMKPRQGYNVSDHTTTHEPPKTIWDNLRDYIQDPLGINDYAKNRK